MKISESQLLKESAITGFRPEILEKVWCLMALLDGINAHPFLKGRLALKGGTALNLFVFELPRLSVDIDLNYIGSIDRSTMLEERPKLESALEAVFQRENMTVRRIPQKHAGGKWQLRYPSALNQGGNLEVDLNYMFRLPLWKVQKISSVMVGNKATKEVVVLDPHELATGKLTALFARTASRDLFDAHYLLTQTKIDWKKLRFAFLLYGAMSSKDWREISLDHISFEEKELKRQLLPVLKKDALSKQDNWVSWTKIMVQESKEQLKNLLPFTENEKEFLNQLYDKGEIVSSLISDDPSTQSIIEAHPLLHWKAHLAKK